MTRARTLATDALHLALAWTLATLTVLAAVLFFIGLGIWRFCRRQWRGLTVLAAVLIAARLGGII